MPSVSAGKTGQRFLTLDVFRGLTLLLMIIVNTQGSGALPFRALMHAEWNGCTLTDLVFPSFLFAAGNSLAFVSRQWQQLRDNEVLYRIARRGLLIFLIGYLLTWYCSMQWLFGRLVFADFSNTRVMAVLQRIALCYVIVALMAKYLKPAGIFGMAIFFLLGYWAVLYRFGEPGLQYTETGNAVRRLDIVILGEKHMYRENGILFDPEGLLSTIPACVNVMAGYLTGVFLIWGGKSKKTVQGLMAVGGVLVICGLLWNTCFPMNKKLWTSSYVLYATGIDLLVIATLFYCIEVRKWTRMVQFFVVLGKNPLFIYVFSNLMLILLIWNITPDRIFIDWINLGFFQRLAPGSLGALLFSISFAMVCWLLAWFMDKWKIYVRI